MNCDGLPGEIPSPTSLFSYFRYAEEVEMSLRRRRIRREMLTDDVLREELFTLYGEMDDSSPKFRRIFDNYKQERMEEVEEEESEDEGMGDPSPLSPGINPFHSHLGVDIDPFLLPRKKRDGPPPEITRNSRNILQGLTQFDPELHLDKLVLVSESRNSKNHGGRNTHEIMQKIVSITRKHPAGIERSCLLGELRKALRRPSLGESDLTNLLENKKGLNGEGLIVHAQEIQEYEKIFYFPPYTEGFLLSPMRMFHNIWHKIRILTNWKMGIIQGSKALRLCSEIFGWVKIRWGSWGFESERQFLSFLVTSFAGSDTFAVVNETGIKKNGRAGVPYIVAYANQKQKRLVVAKMEAERANRSTRPKPTIMPFETAPGRHPVWSGQIHNPNPQTYPRPLATGMQQRHSSTPAFPDLKTAATLPQQKREDQVRRNMNGNKPPPPRTWNKLF